MKFIGLSMKHSSKFIFAPIILPIVMTSCAALPALFQSVEDIEDSEAIELKISNEALENKKDININIDVTTNK